MVIDPYLTRELLGHANVLLARSGLPSALSIELMSGGGNNQLFRLMAENEQYVLKRYYHSDDDPRDRFGHEVSFLEYAKQAAPGWVPDLIACDKTHRLSIMSFEPGERPQSVSPALVKAAASFIRQLNDQDIPKQLPVAADASFTVQEHGMRVFNRINQLAALPAYREHLRFKGLVANLSYEFKRWQKTFHQGLIEGIINDEELLSSHRVISPSDFGFHNALLHGNRIIFVDFEYAGIDDPLKLIADFFSQVAQPVPLAFLGAFLGELVLSKDVKRRIDQHLTHFLQLTRIKWCCIQLRSFASEGQRRLTFSQNNADDALRDRMLTSTEFQIENLRSTMSRDKHGLH